MADQRSRGVGPKLVREQSDPVRREELSRKVEFPLGEKAHLPQDVFEAIDFVT